ncbi:MAG: PEP-CTERM sorting domain-containing protein, partial [Pirellulales bacterium]
DEALELFKSIAIGGTTSMPAGTIDVASGGFVASKAAGNSLATLLAWQNAGMVQNTGKGLVSSWILSNPDYGLAVVDNADLGLISFLGRDVTTDSLIAAPARLGDANLDSLVNFADLVTLAENYETSGGTWAIGDFTADRLVNFADLSLIEQQYGESEEDFATAWALARSLVPLDGDYNENGVVDAADYTVWRNHLGQSFTLDNEWPDAATPGVVDQEDYDFWKAHFGEPNGSGAAAGSGAATSRVAVPEPATLVPLLLAAAGMCVRLRRAA